MNRVRFAIDLGTTTIDTCLVDPSDGTIIAEKSTKNRQSLYGSDVINRIMTVSRNASYMKVMADLVCDDLHRLLCDMLGENDLYASQVDMICICGNTTMVSILLGYDIESLGKAPFKPVLSGNVTIQSGALFGWEDVDCPVLLSGCASAFIGGDILSGMIYLGRDTDYCFGADEKSLLLDLGTNGEMVLRTGERYYATSTACGPAFEGCTRRQNVYGNSVIDAVALAVKTRKISRDGVLCDEYFEKGLDIQGIHIDMDILHQIILAKAAIAAGILSLVSEAGIELSDIQRVYLAGGFGFYLNVDNAVTIGLLPAAFRGKISVAGNTSLAGAVLMLLDSRAALYVQKLTEGEIKVIQLAESPQYKEKLIEYMDLRSR